MKHISSNWIQGESLIPFLCLIFLKMHVRQTTVLLLGITFKKWWFVHEMGGQWTLHLQRLDYVPKVGGLSMAHILPLTNTSTSYPSLASVGVKTLALVGHYCMPLHLVDSE